MFGLKRRTGKHLDLTRYEVIFQDAITRRYARFGNGTYATRDDADLTAQGLRKLYPTHWFGCVAIADYPAYVMMQWANAHAHEQMALPMGSLLEAATNPNPFPRDPLLGNIIPR